MNTQACHLKMSEVFYWFKLAILNLELHVSVV